MINTGCLALNGNKIKHFISEMKADIILCANLFSDVTFFFHLVKVIF
jgi:hypothetical protein